jgi:hypothetical protein
MHRAIVPLFLGSCLAFLGACAVDPSTPESIELVPYTGAQLALCDESPDIVGDVAVMHGCGFLNQFYKVFEHGDAMTGTLCDHAGTCLYGVTAKCGPFFRIEDGTLSALVDHRTGEILTHDRFHSGEDDTVPFSLVLPLDITGVERSAP